MGVFGRVRADLPREQIKYSGCSRFVPVVQISKVWTLSSEVNGPPILPLVAERWEWVAPTRSEAKALVEAAKNGDGAALVQIAKNHHRLVLKIASDYSGPSFDDLVSAGMLGLWKAFDKYDVRRAETLGVYARKFIRGAISDCVRDWRKCGEAGETREQRKNPHTNWHKRYNTIEPLRDDDEDGNPVGQIAADVGGAKCDAQRRLFRQLAKLARSFGVPSEHVKIDDGGRWPDKIIGRRGFRIPIAEGKITPLPLHEYLKRHPTFKKYQINAPTRSNATLGIINYLAREAELRAARRFKDGRQKYADALVAKDRAQRGPIRPLVDGGMGLGFAPSQKPPESVNLRAAVAHRELKSELRVIKGRKDANLTGRPAPLVYRNVLRGDNRSRRNAV